jgi:flagellum-specific ATP synthase
MGSDAEVDRAIALNPALEAFLSQGKDETTPLAEAFAGLAAILADVPAPLTAQAFEAVA